MDDFTQSWNYTKKIFPDEDGKLLELGLGLTNIVHRPTKAAQEITKEEYNEGKIGLKAKIRLFKPAFVCFVGKGVYQEYSGKKEINWGIQTMSIVEGTTDFVAPSSNGLVRMKTEDIINIYADLSKLIKG